MLPGRRAAPDDRLRAVRAEDVGLLLVRAIGYDDLHLVAALPADDCQADPGVARRRLDDGAAGAEGAVALGRLDHCQRGPVLDASAHACELRLRVDRGRDTVPESAQPEERGAAWPGFSADHGPDQGAVLDLGAVLHAERADLE